MKENLGKVIAIANQKGGVSKTTSTRNIAKGLAIKCKKVLVIECDNQASLTTCYGIAEPENLENTIYTLMMRIITEKDLPKKEEYILKVDEIDLIPANIDLADIELNLASAMSREFVLKEIIDVIKHDYDYVLLDCMPSLGMMTLNALVSADSVLIPVTPEYLSAKGLEMLIETVFKARKRLNKGLAFEGIFITMYEERTNLSKEITELISSSYGEHIKIFNTKISKAVTVGKANLYFKSVIEHEPTHKVSKEYSALVEELIK